MVDPSHDFATNAIHAGMPPDSSAVPIYQGVNAPHDDKGVAYVSAVAGNGGPTNEALEELLRTLEGAAWSVTLPAGQAAISHTFFALLQKGDRVVVHNSVYSYATTLLREDLPNRWGVEVEWVDMRDLNVLEEALSKPTRLVYFEPITNPAFHLMDCAGIIQRAKAAGALAVLDNTLLSPFLYQPLAHDADIVLHSATKYLSGHGDVLGGVVSGNDPDLGAQMHRFRCLMGGMLAPMSAYLIMRGIRTLPLRMPKHCANALTIAQQLERLPQVKKVRHPGLESYAATEALKTQFDGAGGIFGFELDPAIDRHAVRARLKLCQPWGSLGDVGSLVAAPAPSAIRDVPMNYLRLAVGLEAPEDIFADLKQAIEGQESE